jgi:hypothetical protein
MLRSILSGSGFVFFGLGLLIVVGIESASAIAPVEIEVPLPECENGKPRTATNECPGDDDGIFRLPEFMRLDASQSKNSDRGSGRWMIYVDGEDYMEFSGSVADLNMNVRLIISRFPNSNVGTREIKDKSVGITSLPDTSDSCIVPRGAFPVCPKVQGDDPDMVDREGVPPSAGAGSR